MKQLDIKLTNIMLLGKSDHFLASTHHNEENTLYSTDIQKVKPKN